MTKKQLQQYRWLRKNIQRLEEKILELESAAEKMTTVISDEPRSSSDQDKLSGIVAKMADIEKALKRQLHKSYIVLGEIENAIAMLPERERYLIRARYIDCRSWEEICVDMNYSWRGIHKIHSKALKILI